jgi:hypothetical protein
MARNPYRWLVALAALLAAPAAHAMLKAAAPVGAPQVLAQSNAAITNTAIGTGEVNMASIPIPAMGASDALRITTLWDTTGSAATNTKNLVIRLSATGCTSLAACVAGTVILNVTMNTASLISNSTMTIIRNAGATNAQVMHGSSNSFGVGAITAVPGSAAVQTNAGSFINIDSITATSSADTIKLLGYTVELIRGQ